MTYLSIFNKATNSKKKKRKKKRYKQKTNILTKYGLPIKSDLISRGKQCRSNNDSPPNRDSNMISIGKAEFRYYVVIIILVNLGKP